MHVYIFLFFVNLHLKSCASCIYLNTEKRCPGLVGPNINITGTTGFFGDIVYVGCILGYYTIDNETNYVSECAENGQWSMDKECFGKAEPKLQHKD